MDSVKLRASEVCLPVVGVGCARLGGAAALGASRVGSIRLIQEAADRGLTFFDTADAYANGDSELLLGEALQTRRSRIQLATKVGYLFQENLGSADAFAPVRFLAKRAMRKVRGTDVQFMAQRFDASYIRRSLECSLRRLRTDYVDLYQLHAPRLASDCCAEVVDTLSGLKRDGKVLAFGLGLENADDLDDWLGFEELSTVQLPFGLLDQHTTAAIGKAAGRGVAVLARGVFGSGLLSPALPPTRLRRLTPKWRRVLAYQKLAMQAGLEVSELAASFALSHPGVCTAVLGVQRDSHLETALRITTSLPLSKELHVKIAHIDQYVPLG